MVGYTRWAFSAAIVVSLHAAIASWLLRDQRQDTDSNLSGALTIELAPIAVARADLPADVAPGPDQMQANAAPDTPKEQEDDSVSEQATTKPVIEPIPQLAHTSDPEPLAVPEKQEIKEDQTPVWNAPPPSSTVQTASASQVEAERKGAVAAATVRGTPGPASSTSMPRWSARLLEQLEQSKRYPATAQSRREEGTTHIAFTLDRQGRLLSAYIQKSSGSQALDSEALAILSRAAPYPPPPSELAGEQLSLTVPIRFRLRG